MSKFLKTLSCVALPAVIIGAIFFYWFHTNTSYKYSTEENIQLIREHLNGAGKLVDYFDEIGVSSAEDIKLFVEEKTITIEFGKILLKWDKEDFVKPEEREKLEVIGIHWYVDEETNRLHVEYKGEEIERWVS